jgi:hypothetical protein
MGLKKLITSQTIFLTLLLLLPTQLGLHFWPQWASVFGMRVDYLSPTIYLTDIIIFLLAIIAAIEKKEIFKKTKAPFTNRVVF